MNSSPGECCWRMIFFFFFPKRDRQENRKFSSSVEGANRPGRKTGDAQRSFYFPKGKEGVHFRFELDIWQDFLLIPTGCGLSAYGPSRMQQEGRDVRHGMNEAPSLNSPSSSGPNAHSTPAAIDGAKDTMMGKSCCTSPCCASPGPRPTGLTLVLRELGAVACIMKGKLHSDNVGKLSCRGTEGAFGRAQNAFENKDEFTQRFRDMLHPSSIFRDNR